MICCWTPAKIDKLKRSKNPQGTPCPKNFSTTLTVSLSIKLYLCICLGPRKNDPDAALMRQFLMHEGHVHKMCLAKILKDVTKMFSKFKSNQMIVYRKWAKFNQGSRALCNYWRYSWAILWYDPHVSKSDWSERNRLVSPPHKFSN